MFRRDILLADLRRNPPAASILLELRVVAEATQKHRGA
jgi:hypothetical protein